MPGCPHCGRPVALARATCLYCGRELPEDLRPAPPPNALPGAGAAAALGPEAAGTAPAAPERALVVLDLTDVAAQTLAELTGGSLYDADRRIRRGGWQLHAACDAAAAAEQEARFRAAGVLALVLPEAEVRAAPSRALRIEAGDEGLVLDTTTGRRLVNAHDLLLAVSGPIARAPGTELQRRRIDSARLQESWCTHLHLLDGPPPIELEASRLEWRSAVTGSPQLELRVWLEALAETVPHDQAFRLETPVLAPPPSEDDPIWPFERTRGRARQRAGSEPPPIHDNLAQFRFYSGWRGAVERRRPGSRARTLPC